MSDGKRTEGHYLTVSESFTFLKVISKAMQISLKKINYPPNLNS